MTQDACRKTKKVNLQQDQVMNYSKKVASIFNEHASSYASRFADQSLYHEAFHCFLSLLPKHATVLDLGSGPGNVAKYLLNKSATIESYLAIDLAEDMLQLAAEIDPRIRTVCCNALDVSSYSEHLPKSGIIASFCAPYWKDEELNLWIQKITENSDSETVLYFSAMSNKQDISGIKTNSHGQQLWMNFYDDATLRNLFERNAWSVLHDFSIHEEGRHEIVWVIKPSF